MYQRSLFSLDFAALIGGTEQIIPCCRYRDILDGPESNDWQSTVQTDALIASPWITHRGLGNAAKTLGFTVLRAFEAMAQAEQYAADREYLLHMHPDGHAIYRYAWHGGIPMCSERWLATVQQCRATPATPDTSAGTSLQDGRIHGAWCAVEYQFLMTRREII